MMIKLVVSFSVILLWHFGSTQEANETTVAVAEDQPETYNPGSNVVLLDSKFETSLTVISITLNVFSRPKSSGSSQSK